MIFSKIDFINLQKLVHVNVKTSESRSDLQFLSMCLYTVKKVRGFPVPSRDVTHRVHIFLEMKQG